MSSISELKFYCDVLIIGSGAAGLSLALRLAPHYKIFVLSKELVNEGSTLYAKGGIAAVFDTFDSINSHIEDTISAGAGIVDKNVAKFVISNARNCIQWLINQGVIFDKEIQSDNKITYHLNKEGGHSYRRILHSSDATGKEIEKKLIDKALNHHNIKIFEFSYAIDLITTDKIKISGPRRVIGVWVWNKSKKIVETYHSRIVVLATGGASKIYQYTTNPDVSSGDGIAIGWRAGCRVANLEFNQFHPTVLFHSNKCSMLLTEALRGEGALLKRPDGSRFMYDFDSRGELAPRDIVTRAIFHEMKRLDVDCMYLDISHKQADFICKYFPNTHKQLLELGIDFTKHPIPIVPAAHYTCGGIVVDNYGRTDIDCLYAIGEVSYTGLHGANRIASNSLLECLVYSFSAAKNICEHIPYVKQINNLPCWKAMDKEIEIPDELLVIQHNCRELRSLMWNYVGIIRSTKRLERAMCRINILKDEINKYYSNFYISNNLLELRNLVQVAELIVQCAMMRKESRGLHYILDYPYLLNNSGPSIISPLNYINNIKK